MIPEPILALRRQALVIAANRAFRGSIDPIPELPAFPGYRPIHTTKETRAQERKERAREAKLARQRAARGVKREHNTPREPKPRKSEPSRIAPGTVVRWKNLAGVVVGFVPAGVDPWTVLPPDVKRWRLILSTGQPADIHRYAIASTHPRVKGTVYRLAKAATIERFNRTEGAA